MTTKTKAKQQQDATITASNVAVSYLPAFDSEKANPVIALAGEIVGSSQRQGPMLWAIIEEVSAHRDPLQAMRVTLEDFAAELKAAQYGGTATRKSELNKVIAVCLSDPEFMAVLREILLTTGKGLQGAYKLALKAESMRSKATQSAQPESDSDDDAAELDSAEPTASDSIGTAYAAAQQALAALAAALSDAGRDDTAAKVNDGLLYLRSLSI